MKSASHSGTHGTSVHRAQARAGSQKGKSARPQDATALLKADHDNVTKLFEEFEQARSADKKKALVTKICNELTIHAQIEEEIFYPAVKEALGDEELVPEALVEHQSLKELIAQIEEVDDVEDEMFTARVTVLSEYVKHHVKEEQSQMFKQAKASELDLKELGARLAERKAELMQEAE